MPRLARVLVVAWLCLGAPLLAAAQEPATEAPAHISLIDGAVVLERDGQTESAPASMPLLAGDRVRTQNGRAEILFADGSTLHLDTGTRVDFQSDAVIRLLDGRVRLNIVGPRRRLAYRIDAPAAWVDITSPGEYRVSVLGDDREREVELAVLRGAADLVNDDGRTSLDAGERAFARDGSGPSNAYVFNSAAWDPFDRWSEGRRDARLGVSAQYLPDTVQPYAATFNQYGSWQNVETYGYVWYPRVSPGWRPYFNGRWNTLRPWGWTWIGSDPWAWPTHHYGRWGFNAGAWFWIPGRSWGPAWVSWAYAPGYVSWCPLGWNNRPVLGFVNVNVRTGYRHDPWNAWTVVPHRGFGTGFVNTSVISASRIDVRTRGAFVVRDAAPDVRGYAVPRSSAPIRVAGTPGGPVGGNAAYRGGPATSARPLPRGDADAADRFRTRGAPSGPLNGSGYPAPAREPRQTSSLPSPDRQGAVSRSRDAAGQPAAPENPSRIERRATPREGSGAVPPPSPMSPTPSRRSAPEYYRGTPVPDPSAPSTGDPANRGRAVPRSDPRVVESPSREYRSPQERSPYRSPSADAPDRNSYRAPSSAPERTPSGDAPDRGARPMPRSGGDGGTPPPSGIRSRPGPESGTPGSAGSPPPRPSGGGDSRSRGGGESSGRAAPRGRGR